MKCDSPYITVRSLGFSLPKRSNSPASFSMQYWVFHSASMAKPRRLLGSELSICSSMLILIWWSHFWTSPVGLHLLEWSFRFQHSSIIDIPATMQFSPLKRWACYAFSKCSTPCPETSFTVAQKHGAPPFPFRVLFSASWGSTYWKESERQRRLLVQCNQRKYRWLDDSWDWLEMSGL